RRGSRPPPRSPRPPPRARPGAAGTAGSGVARCRSRAPPHAPATRRRRTGARASPRHRVRGRWRWHAGGPARRRRAAPPGWRAGTARTGRAGRTPPPAVHAAPGCGRRGSPRSGRAAPRTRSCARPARSTDGRAGWSSRPRLPPDGRRVRRSPPAAAGRRPWPAAGRPAPRRRHRRPPPRRTRPPQALRCPCRPSTGSGSGGVVRRHVAGGLVGAAAEQELLHLGLEEGAVIRVERREAVLVDQHGLVGEPRGPCRLADAGEDPLAKLARPRHEVETLGFALFVLAEDDP